MASTEQQFHVLSTQVRFNGDSAELHVVALKAIAEGEEVCISYLDQCQLARSRHSRVKLLRENYLFECACSRCQIEVRDQADATSEEEDEDEDEDGAEANGCVATAICAFVIVIKLF